jgi:hypothetical protein
MTTEVNFLYSLLAWEMNSEGFQSMQPCTNVCNVHLSSIPHKPICFWMCYLITMSIATIIQHRWQTNKRVCSIGEMMLTRRKLNYLDKTYVKATLSTTNSTRTGRGLNQSLYGEALAAWAMVLPHNIQWKWNRKIVFLSISDLCTLTHYRIQ